MQSLPDEILLNILAITVQDISSEELLDTMRKYILVCKRWYHVIFGELRSGITPKSYLFWNGIDLYGNSDPKSYLTYLAQAFRHSIKFQHNIQHPNLHRMNSRYILELNQNTLQVTNRITSEITIYDFPNSPDFYLLRNYVNGSNIYLDLETGRRCSINPNDCIIGDYVSVENEIYNIWTRELIGQVTDHHVMGTNWNTILGYDDALYLLKLPDLTKFYLKFPDNVVFTLNQDPLYNRHIISAPLLTDYIFISLDDPFGLIKVEHSMYLFDPQTGCIFRRIPTIHRNIITSYIKDGGIVFDFF